MYAPDPNEKLDFECLDVRLYMALQKALPYVEHEAASLEALAHNDETMSEHADKAADAVLAAKHVMMCFENSHGPMPEWAIARNFGYELIPGAQLCTLDGRRHGNGWIVDTEKRELHAPENSNHFQGYKTFYRCITDAGSTMTFTEQELRTAFTIGDWICTKERILKDFDRHGHFTEEPL